MDTREARSELEQAQVALYYALDALGTPAELQALKGEAMELMYLLREADGKVDDCLFALDDLESATAH